ncbi:hypothetical protein TNCV_3135981 [Trichonephila clavipes]|nr:hypothetical protein TNCV_3135981 [Trichonephila clavipes]
MYDPALNFEYGPKESKNIFKRHRNANSTSTNKADSYEGIQPTLTPDLTREKSTELPLPNHCKQASRTGTTQDLATISLICQNLR